MSNIPILNFFGIAVSVYNVVLMLWLGLTVLLNAERRVWGVLLAGGALILGGAFVSEARCELFLASAGLYSGSVRGSNARH